MLVPQQKHSFLERDLSALYRVNLIPAASYDIPLLNVILIQSLSPWMIVTILPSQLGSLVRCVIYILCNMLDWQKVITFLPVLTRVRDFVRENTRC